MEGDFIPGDHLINWCNKFQLYKLLSILSARKHSKSEIAHAYLAWRIFNMDYAYIEKWLYLSYTGDLAGEHLRDTKERIRVNPFFSDVIDLTDATTILYYQKGNNRFFCQPAGILSFKRGKHPDGVICDDILRDPEVKLDLSQIEKITQIFFEQVMSLPKERGLGLKNIGTAQDENDLFHQLEGKKQFDCSRWDAIKSEKRRLSLWPEMFPYERLEQIRDDEIGPKAFLKEYRCVPVRSTEGYFTHEDMDRVIHPRLRNYKIYDTLRLNEDAVGGLDIGKKRHPSHLVAYGIDRHGKLVQLLSLWMDGTDYADQLRICKEVIKNFSLRRLYYDDTRAEFEGFKELGDLPGEMKGIPFTSKLKHQVATKFGKRVNKGNILMLDDPRQTRQILNCDNDLKSAETAEGHGDSFWSNALAVHAADGTQPKIYFL